jgi:hypothetical protein
MTILRSIAAPSLALRRPCCPIDLTIPDLPKGAKGLGLGGQRQCWSTPSDASQPLATQSILADLCARWGPEVVGVPSGTFAPKRAEIAGP